MDNKDIPATTSDDFDNPTSSPSSAIVVRKPKRVLHCSDGVYEEYSSEDDENDKVIDDISNQSMFRKVGRKVLNVIDFAGESIAGFFNLTTPKYSYEIEQFKKEQARRAVEEQIERDNTWKSDTNDKSVITTAPESSSRNHETA
jgi:FAM177 family